MAASGAFAESALVSAEQYARGHLRASWGLKKVVAIK
jgi:hypothetical protein